MMETKDTLAKLAELIDGDKMHIFSPSEVKAIRSMIAAWTALSNYGALGKFLIWIAGAVGGLILLWHQIKGSP